MCGIAGYMGLEPGSAGEAVLHRMARLMVHRGPDGEGIAVHGRVGLAHRRLAVIDRAGGEQPMRSAYGRYVMVYNGEVYNHRELRDELTAAGHEFHTRSDTEVVLAAWVRWGAAAFDRFNGMFALAILDTASGEVVLARDQFGIKPLYYAADGSGRVAFASEIRPVLAAGVVPRRPDDLTIYRYLRFRVHDDTERTFFDRVTRLLPGQLAVITPDGQVRRENYTRLGYELAWLAASPRPYDADAAGQFASTLRAAVRRRLVSDVPVGTALSGGLDSSTVVATINRLLAGHDAEAASVGGVQKTFSAVFPGHRNDEERHVDAVAAGCGRRLEVHKVRPDPDRFLDDLRDFVRTQEEPVISTGPYAQYCVMREAGRHVTVMLDGQGADEILAGYYPYLLVRLRELRRDGRHLAAAAALARGADGLWRLSRPAVADWLRRRRPVPVSRLLGRGFAASFAEERLEVVTDDLKRRLTDDIFRHSLPALLRYEDRNSMRFSVEGRVPFLDPDLLRLLWSLDPAAIIGGGWTKRALRDATAGLLPEPVRLRRDKIGFTTPEEAWFTRIKSFVHEVFTSESFGSRPYFDQAAVTAAFRDYLAGRNSAETMVFWRLLNVELWLREMVDRDPTVPEPASSAAHPPGLSGGSGGPATAATATATAAVLATPDWVPNPDKDLVTADRRWARFPLRVDLVRPGDEVAVLVANRVSRFFARLPDAPAPAAALAAGDHTRWYLYLSEKAVAIAQGRSFYTWEISPTWWARRLSRFVVRTPYGIGLGDPTTMQLAIDEVGLPRVLLAAAVSVAGKAVGRRGWFYRVTGPRVAAIDGPTQYSVYPANVSAKLAPADPDGVARCVSAAIRGSLPAPLTARYGGAVVIDANDLGQKVLGHDTGLPPAELAAVFADNPLGQGREQTPYAVVVDLAALGSLRRNGDPASRAAARTDGVAASKAGATAGKDGAMARGDGAAASKDGQRRNLRRTSPSTSLTSRIRSSRANNR